MSRRLFIASLFDGCLVDKHHGDVVLDEINAFTLDALQSAPIRLQLNFRLASRTREYFQEFLTNCHWLDLSKALLRECGKLTTKPLAGAGSTGFSLCGSFRALRFGVNSIKNDFTQRHKVCTSALSRFFVLYFLHVFGIRTAIRLPPARQLFRAPLARVGSPEQFAR